mgnify:CR=1 FL=1
MKHVCLVKKSVWAASFLVGLLGFFASASAQSKATYKKVEGSEIKRVAKGIDVRQSPKAVGDSLGSPAISGVVHAFRGPAGPFKKGYVHANVSERGFSFWVFGNVEGEWQAWSPVAVEGADVEAVFFDDVQGDGLVEVFVLYSVTRGGIHGASTHYTAEALEWNPKNSRFERRPGWLKELNASSSDKNTTGPTTAKAVREHIAKHGATKVASAGAPEAVAHQGKLAAEDVRSVIRRHRYEVKSCHKKGLKANPGAKGSLTLDVVVSETGSVTSAKVRSSQLDDKAIEGCVVKKVKRWTFPVPEGGSAAIMLPFNF